MTGSRISAKTSLSLTLSLSAFYSKTVGHLIDTQQPPYYYHQSTILALSGAAVLRYWCCVKEATSVEQPSGTIVAQINPKRKFD